MPLYGGTDEAVPALDSPSRELCRHAASQQHSSVEWIKDLGIANKTRQLPRQSDDLGEGLGRDVGDLDRPPRKCAAVDGVLGQLRRNRVAQKHEGLAIVASVDELSRQLGQWRTRHAYLQDGAGSRFRVYAKGLRLNP